MLSILGTFTFGTIAKSDYEVVPLLLTGPIADLTLPVVFGTPTCHKRFLNFLTS